MKAPRDVLTEKFSAFSKIDARPESVEFIFSKKGFGPVSAKFTEEQRASLLDRLRSETGAYVVVVASIANGYFGCSRRHHLYDCPEIVSFNWPAPDFLAIIRPGERAYKEGTNDPLPSAS
jgi:hypothetical protein